MNTTKHLLALAGVLLLQCTVFAQQPKQVTLTGSVNVNSGESFQYKLVLTEADGIVKGYSLTYKEPNETKAVILGTLDRHKHKLSFKEKDILYSHGFHTKAYMCLIDATLEYVQIGNNYELRGPITSAESDNTVCTGGTISFTNQEEIQNLFGYHEQYDTVISMKKKVKDEGNNKTVKDDGDAKIVNNEGNNKDATDGYKVNNEQAAVTRQIAGTDKITAGIEKAYDWHSDTVVIDVWDGGNVDGDRITVLFNDKPCLTNYYLVKEKRQLRIPMADKPINTLVIVANTEGSDPPNTASILLTDGKKKYNVLAYNRKGQHSTIKLRRVK